MMYQYHIEILENGNAQTQMDALSGDGWRLVSAFSHPSETVNAEPKLISFWERQVA